MGASSHDDRASRARGSQKGCRDAHGGEATRESRFRGNGGKGDAYANVEENASVHERALRPAKMTADGAHPECQLAPVNIADAGEIASGDAGKKAGKKRQKPSNKVVMRWG